MGIIRIFFFPVLLFLVFSCVFLYFIVRFFPRETVLPVVLLIMLEVSDNLGDFSKYLYFERFCSVFKIRFIYGLLLIYLSITNINISNFPNYSFLELFSSVFIKSFSHLFLCCYFVYYLLVQVHHVVSNP